MRSKLIPMFQMSMVGREREEKTTHAIEHDIRHIIFINIVDNHPVEEKQ